MSAAWEVLSLFLIPVGGGIPAGVLLAKTKGFAWPAMMGLYFISDIIQAIIFEPILHGLAKLAKRSERFQKFATAYKASMQKSVASYGINPGPFALIMISFGIDPLTGRTAALTAGHGFMMGWTLAITGDMVYFVVLMVSTLCLNSVLGDGTWTAVIIMVAMFAIPALIRKIRAKK
jgi:hypothetical protein